MAPYSWRREALWIALAMGVAAAVRLAALPYVLAYFHADSAIGALMAKHMAEGAAWPAYYYGQDYIGSVEPALGAALYAVFPADPRGLGLALAVSFLAALVPLHRLLYHLGGPVGARAGTLLLAAGTPAVVVMSTGFMFGYLATLWIGALLYLQGLALARSPGLSGAFRLGLLAGLGWWTNPQVAQYLAPVALALACRGEAARLIARGELSARLGPWWRGFALAFGVLGLAFLLCFALCARDTPLVWGPVSLRSPARYLLRLGGAVAALCLVLELVASRQRRALVAGLCAWGLGAAVGALPALAHRLAGIRQGPGAPFLVDPRRVPANLRELGEEGGGVLIGMSSHLAAIPAPWSALHAGAGRLIVAGLLVGAAALLARELAALRRSALRGAPELGLGGQLAVQVALLLGLYLCADTEWRYLFQLWLPWSALVAWSAGAGWARARGATLLALALVALYYAAGLAVWLRGLPASMPPGLRALAAQLDRDGPRLGRASYFDAYRLAYLSGERVRFACWNPAHDRLPAHRRAVAEAARRGERVALVFTDFPETLVWSHINRELRPIQRRYLEGEAVADPPPPRPVERRRVGPYLVYR